jgi:raffinose/stachyose/melibiose transport system substrate-binding protein
MKKKHVVQGVVLAGVTLSTILTTGCGDTSSSGKIEVTMLQYKPEAVDAFQEMEDRFNATHDDIHLTIESPNEATTVLKTRFIREDYPDIIGIGGDINYSNFLDAGMFLDVSDCEIVDEIKPAYMEILKELEFIPQDGVYGLPYVSNCAGVLYNRGMFEEYGWEIPETWSEFITLCDTIEDAGIQPLYFGFKDTWTCLAPWNALAVGLAPADTCSSVSAGKTTFTEAYYEVAEKMKVLLDYAEPSPYAYGYNDACTAFAREQSAMYVIGSYAVPQIQSVNPDIDIDSFPFPANEKEEDNVLNSGVDLQFCVMKQTENKDAVYEVLRFLYDDETIQIYLDNQNAVPCKEGDFQLPSMLDGMTEYIEEGRMADYQDHHYPSEMSVDAMIQTFLMDTSDDAIDTFLTRFDTDWERYNRDLIAKVQAYEEEKGEQ